MLWVCAGIGVAGVVLALAFLPWRAVPGAQEVAATGRGREGAESPHERVA
jgi:hypothetical protein